MRKLIVVVFWISFGLTVASFGGALHGLGDSLAVFRHWWAIGLSASSLLMLGGHMRSAGLGALVVVLAVAPMASGHLTPDTNGAPRYSLYQKNLLYNGSAPGDIIADIQDLAPDFVTLEEVSRRNRHIFDTLARGYPSHLFCKFAGVGGVAVLSKWPVIEGSENCAGEQGLAAMQVQTPDGPVWVGALHLHWPYPHSQSKQVANLVAAMGFLKGPVVLGGDFNMVPWSHTLRQFERATGSDRAGRVLRTFKHDTFPLRLPIDHILTPEGQGTLELRGLLGSDHFGVLARFDL